jgi:hypothetical protein
MERCTREHNDLIRQITQCALLQRLLLKHYLHHCKERRSIGSQDLNPRGLHSSTIGQKWPKQKVNINVCVLEETSGQGNEDLTMVLSCAFPHLLIGPNLARSVGKKWLSRKTSYLTLTWICMTAYCWASLPRSASAVSSFHSPMSSESLPARVLG